MIINWTGIKAFIVNHKNWAMAVVAILLFAFGFGAGLLAKPEKIVTKDKVVEKAVEHVVYKDRIVEHTVLAKATHQKVHKETVTTKQKDGSEVVKNTEDTSTDTDTDINKDKTVYVDRVVEKVVTQTVEKEKLVVNKKPQWMIGAGVGVSIPTLLGQTNLGVPGLHGFVVEVDAQRRVVGPFFLGIFGNTQGTAGLKLSGEF